MRPLRRKLTSRRLRKVAPPAADASAAASRPAHWRMRCMCGTILEIAAEDDGKRQTCATCRRVFDIRFTEDVGSGQKGVSLLYHGGENKANEETSVGAGTTSFELSSGGNPNPAGLLMEPDLPDEAHFKCGCGALLAVAKAQFEKRAKCPACGARMLIFMLFDSAKASFNLQTFTLVDQSTGSTQILSKL